MSDWAFSVIADPDLTCVVDPDVFDGVELGQAAARWQPLSLNWMNPKLDVGDVANMSTELQVFSGCSADALGLEAFGDLLPLTIGGRPYFLFDCTWKVPEAAVVDIPGSTYIEAGKLVYMQVLSVPPGDAPPVFRVAGQETFLIWSAPLAKRVLKACAGAVILPWAHAA